PIVSDPKTRQAEFEIRYIWVALATAVFVGFVIGAHLAFVIGYDFSVGKGFYAFIQTHGHVQLVGWVGLFIIGISLHLIPRMASVPLSRPLWIPWILWLMATGLLLRSIGHTVVPYLAGGALFLPVSWLVVGSGLLEWAGIVMYGLLLIRTLGGIGNIHMQPALMSVRPYFGMMLTGWFLYESLNLILLVHMVVRRDVVLDTGWNEFAIEVFVSLVLLPVALAFSVRMLPLYLTLRAPDWPVRGAGYAYLVCVILHVVPTAPVLSEIAPEPTRFLSSLGMLMKGGVILWFVWQFDILIRRWEPWTAKWDLQRNPDRRPTRPGLPDYGEFGPFERLVYAAYAWLVLAACFEVLDGAAIVLGLPPPVGTDSVRHMYLLGFITHLIFGISVRLIPGLLKKKCVASPRLVEATLWLGGTAVVCRVVPLLIPTGVFEAIPASLVAAQSAFALSGIIGLGAVLCLGINLWQTARG
ncbi:MAG: hypothetical protein ACE5K9_09900, partial [Candidatus Methylomirabilales bacterium]